MFSNYYLPNLLTYPLTSIKSIVIKRIPPITTEEGDNILPTWKNQQAIFYTISIFLNFREVLISKTNNFHHERFIILDKGGLHLKKLKNMGFSIIGLTPPPKIIENFEKC